MTITQLSGSLACGISAKKCERRSIKNVAKKIGSKISREGHPVHYFAACDNRRLRFNNVARRCRLISEQQTSDYELSAPSLEASSLEVEDIVASKNGTVLSKRIL